MIRIFNRLIFLTTLMCYTLVSNAQTILVEAEQFQEKGGWVVDPQFTGQMGSPFLLAHGNGTPVKDAVTKVKFDKKGTYTLWVRTRNWNSPWDPKQAPGRFKILIDGKDTGLEFGTTPEKWGWVNAGKIEIRNSEPTVSLHDLTGFDGRCDAILFSGKKGFTPPDDPAELKKLRSKLLGLEIKNEGDYDLVVVGGGMAGIAASVSAARLGLKTALIQNRPVVGGNNSPEIPVVASGEINLPPYKNIGNVVKEIGNVYQNYNRVLDLIQKEPNLSLFLNTNADDVEMQGSRIKAILASDVITSRKHRFNCKYAADCSGDGTLAFMAGADYRMGREMQSDFNEMLAPEVHDNLSLGSTIPWSAQKTEKEKSFPLTPWAVHFTEVTAQQLTRGDNWWETGFRYDQIRDFEYIRDYALRVIYGNWSFLKNASQKKQQYSFYDLNDVGFIAGKRESRRILGDILVTQNDVEAGWKTYSDGCVWATYSIDQHFPRAENTLYFPGEEFLSTQKHNYNPLGVSRSQLKDTDVNAPWMIPYRSLYSRNINNLFMAGRNISVTRIVLNSTRVQRTAGMMGEVVALAARLCIQNRCQPREIYSSHLAELKKSLAEGVPANNQK